MTRKFNIVSLFKVLNSYKETTEVSKISGEEAMLVKFLNRPRGWFLEIFYRVRPCFPRWKKIPPGISHLVLKEHLQHISSTIHENKISTKCIFSVSSQPSLQVLISEALYFLLGIYWGLGLHRNSSFRANISLLISQLGPGYIKI